MAISPQLRDRLARDPGLVLGADDLQQLDAKFNKIDVDGDGEITREELRSSLGGGGAAAPFVTESRVESFLKDMDLDGDGSLTFEELASATAVRRVEKLVTQILREEVGLDPNGDADDPSLKEEILDKLLELVGLYDAPEREACLAALERGEDGRAYPEPLALAFFAVKKG